MSKSGVKPEQIKSVGNRWARKQFRRGRAHSLKWSRQLFIQIATDWLRFMHRLDEPLNGTPSFMKWIKDFTNWMESDRGLSLITIRNYRWHITKFFHWCGDINRSISAIHISDVDTFLASCGKNGWSRVFVATSAKALKAFFRYAGQHGWCSSAIAHAIQGPRLFSQDSLPYGPTWDDVNRMINYLTTDKPQDIRDRVIILLFSLYGFRSGEVSRLHFENINWENNLISVFRPKQRRTQIYPLIPIVGNAIVHYLQAVRPQTIHREIFLTLKAPIRPLSVGSLYNIVHRCMTKIGLHVVHQGPHALRHACATHLMSKGLRDHVMLLFLYNSGARASEAAHLSIEDLNLGNPPSVTLFGKGEKIRQCPLWSHTASKLTLLFIGRDSDHKAPVFLNRYKQPITRFGIRALVKRSVQIASQKLPDLSSKRITTHTIRHTTAVHLLRSGVDINTIRAWLGHVSLDTTHIYAEVDLGMKAKALAQCEIPALASETNNKWSNNPKLMNFLKSL